MADGSRRRGHDNSLIASRLFAVVLATVWLAACQTGEPPPLSLDEAKKVTASFEGRSFVPPPRTIEDVTRILKQPDPTGETNIARKRQMADQSPPATAEARALAEFFSRRGIAALEIGRSKQAIRDLTTALEIARSSGSRRLQVNILSTLSHAETISGNRAQALRHRKERRELADNTGSRLSSDLSVAWAYLYAGNIEEATKSLRSASTILPETRTWPDQSWVPQLRSQAAIIEGQILLARGMYAESEKKMREAVEILENDIENGADPDVLSGGGITLGTSRIILRNHYLSILAESLMHQGRLAEAEVNSRKALDGNLKQFGRASTYTAGVLVAFSNILSRRGRFADAINLARSAVDIYGEIGTTPDSHMWANARRVLAETLAANGQWEASLREFETIRGNLANDDPQAFQGRFDGNVDWVLSLIKTGNSADALAGLARTLGREVEKFGGDHYGIAERRALTAMARAVTGDRTKALDLFSKASANLLSHSQQSEDESGNRTHQDWRRKLILEAYLDLLSKTAGTFPGKDAEINEKTFRIANAIRAQHIQRALIASAARVATRVPELADLARREQDARKRIGALFSILGTVFSQPSAERDETVVASLRNEIEQLRRARAALLDEINGRFPEYANLIDPKPATIEDARSALRPGESLISTYVGDEQTYVWAVPHEGEVAFAAVDLDRESVVEMVGLVRSSLEPNAATLGDIPDFDVDTAYELYANLLEPVKAGWKGAESLLVVAHGPLGYLPLSVLPTEPVHLSPAKGALFSNHRNIPWLVRKHALTVLPSVASLRMLRGLPPVNAGRKAFAGFGDPVFDKGQVVEAGRCRSVARDGATNQALDVRGVRVCLRAVPEVNRFDSAQLAQLPDLPDTAEEIRSIALALDADLTRDVFLGEEASEAVVKSMDLSGTNVLAFATHGLVPGDLDGLTEPALALSSPAVVGGGDDGLLTMGEILGLKLNADWVVLSACNTASGSGAGAEAVSGLGSAFFYAGTRALLVSNWPVETTSAKALTTDLFRRQAADTTLTRADALRHAMLALIDGAGYVDSMTGKTVFSYAHPIFWAPFTIVGDGGGLASPTT